MRNIIITLLMVLLPFGAEAYPSESVMASIRSSLRAEVPPMVETRLPHIKEFNTVPAYVPTLLNSPSPYWSMGQKAPKISEAKAAAWEDTLKLHDNPNANVVADTIDTSKLKIVCAGPIGLNNTDEFTNTVAIQAYLVEQKELGYNAVLFEWITCSAVASTDFVAIVTWAKSEFATVIIAPSPAPCGRFMPSMVKTDDTLNALMDQADVVLLGWGFTIDTVIYGDESSNEFCNRFFRWVETQAAAKGIPLWGNLYTRIHGSSQKYQYTPENLTAYVCGNIVPSGMYASTDVINATIASHGVPAGKKIILGPFQGARADKSVAIYNKKGFGVIKRGGE
jgi:hypothetical protein